MTTPHIAAAAGVTAYTGGPLQRIEATRVLPTTHTAVATWCGATPATNAHGEIVGLTLPYAGNRYRVPFGDYIAHHGGAFFPVKAALFESIYRPAGTP